MGNTAIYGGGLYFNDSSVKIIKNSVFFKNVANKGGGGGFSTSYSNIDIITYCFFSDNFGF